MGIEKYLRVGEGVKGFGWGRVFGMVWVDGAVED